MLASACTVVAVATPAEAQSQARSREITIGVSNRIQYNSDAVLSDQRISDGRGTDDVSTTPSLDLDIYLPRATGSMFLRGNLGYTFYRKFTRLNRENLELEAGLDQRVFADCIAHASGTYSRRLSDLGDLLADVAIGDSYKNSEERRSLSADIGCGGGIGLRPSVAVSRTEVRNSSVLRKYADADTNSLTGQIGYSSPTLGVVSIFGRFSDSKYINRVSPTGQDDGVRTYAAGVQLERNIGTRLNFTGSVNYNTVKPYLSSVRTFNGIGFDLSSTYRGDFFQVSLTGSRAAEPSTLLFVSYDIQTMFGLNLATEITPRIRWSGGFSYRRREFAPSPIFFITPVRGSENLYTLNAGLSYRASRRLRFLLDGSYSKRDSDVRLFGYDQKRISLTTSLTL